MKAIRSSWLSPIVFTRQFSIAAGTAGSIYDNHARQYARILARNGVQLNVRSTAGAPENLHLLRDRISAVRAALTTFGLGDIERVLGYRYLLQIQASVSRR